MDTAHAENRSEKKFLSQCQRGQNTFLVNISFPEIFFFQKRKGNYSIFNIPENILSFELTKDNFCSSL